MNYPISPASMARIQNSYQQFEQLVGVIAEAMGVDINAPYQLDLQGRQIVVPDPPALTAAPPPTVDEVEANGQVVELPA